MECVTFRERFSNIRFMHTIMTKFNLRVSPDRVPILEDRNFTMREARCIFFTENHHSLLTSDISL